MSSRSRRLLALVALATCSAGCVARPSELRLGGWIRVGVDREREASEVTQALERAGYVVRARLSGEGFVAIGFAREADDRWAVRVVTRLGVVVALDSHETDGVRIRHGAVSLVETDDHDLDGDGRPEIIVAREGPEGTCLAVVRIGEDGRAAAVEVESDEVAPGSCASSVDDVDGDGQSELLVELEWPMLALADVTLDDDIPAVRVPLVARDGGWRADGLPSAFEEAERERLRAALAAARTELDVDAASRVGVALAALANLAGTPLAAQVQRYDEALSGLVLREVERERVMAIRAYIAAGWRARTE